MTNQWVVHLNGKFSIDLDDDDEDGGAFELSVAIKGCHGTQSWGWEGPDKIIILNSDIDCYETDYEDAVRRAGIIAKALNDYESPSRG